MIVPMKKVTVVVQSKDIEPTLKELGRAGVLHIEHQNVPTSESITALIEKHRALSRVIEALPAPEAQESGWEHPEVLVEQLSHLIDEKEIKMENLKKIKKALGAWREWGDFDPELIDDLKDKGIWLRLCKISKKEAQNVPKGVILEQLFRKGNILYCAVISRQEIPLPFHTLTLPEQGLQEMFESEEREEYRLNEIDAILEQLARHKNVLFSYKRELDFLIEFNKVREGRGKFEKLSYLRGYCPAYNVNVLERKAEEEKWGIIVEDPGDNDNPPTLIKNPKWVELIKPVFKLINTIPGYRELDISPHFLIFFSLFFGMLIGDAGYGILYIFTAMFLQWKIKELKDRKVFFLTYLLSSVAIGWGLITGVFFGHHPWLKPLVPYFANALNIQSFCFLLGATQLSIAHLWKFLRKWPSLKVLSDIGWIFILWTAYFLANTLILSKPFPVFAKWFFIVGAVLIILFTNPVKNILKCIGLGIGDFLLKLMNSFGDIVSYIRLFAVGAAGVAIADAFNQIAGNIQTGGNILNVFFSFIVLFLGHTLNIIMGILAIVVHGIRLNILEFSGHLGIEWSGTEYAPFSQKEGV